MPEPITEPRSRYGLSAWERAGVPNPGTHEAQELGCKCPRMDNCNGHGMPPGAYGSLDEGPVFWLVQGCSVHPLQQKEERR